MAFDRCIAQTTTVISKLFSLFRVIIARKCVRQIIFAETPGDTVNTLVFDGLTRTLRRTMTRTRFRRLCKVVRLVEPRPECFIKVEFLEIVIVCISRIANHKINVLTRRWMNRERNELLRERIETSLRPRTWHTLPCCQRRIPSRLT